MTIEQALLTKLLSATAITNLTGQRIYYAGKVPQDVTLPFVTFQTIDDIPTHSHDGFSNFSTVRVQINSFASTYLGVKALDTAVFTAIDSQKTTWSGLRVSCQKDMSGDFQDDDEPDICGIHTDYMIMYNS
jgi:hypothetical protein